MPDFSFAFKELAETVQLESPSYASALYAIKQRHRGYTLLRSYEWKRDAWKERKQEPTAHEVTRYIAENVLQPNCRLTGERNGEFALSSGGQGWIWAGGSGFHGMNPRTYGILTSPQGDERQLVLGWCLPNGGLAVFRIAGAEMKRLCELQEDVYQRVLLRGDGDGDYKFDSRVVLFDDGPILFLGGSNVLSMDLDVPKQEVLLHIPIRT